MSSPLPQVSVLTGFNCGLSIHLKARVDLSFETLV